MKYLVLMMALVTTPAVADGFEGQIPQNVCWYDNKAFSIGSYHPNISYQARGAVTANINHGYGLFCVMNEDIPAWQYMDYDHENERWVVGSRPLHSD